MIKNIYNIIAETGIHARPATMLVQTASKYESDIELSYDGKTVNLKSIMGVMSLWAGQHAEVEIAVDGPDEKEAVEAIEATLENEKLIS